jgi:N-acetylglucosaminyldiphosphoundecaprenol N-acetyl-beta-D-mannosaminyltransferase
VVGCRTYGTGRTRVVAIKQQAERALQRVDFLGLPLDAGGTDAMLKVLEQLSASDTPQHVAMLDMARTLRARLRAEHRRFVRQAGAVLTSSALVAGSAAFLGRKGVEPVRVFDLVIRLLSLAERNDRTVYLLGGSKDVLQHAERNLRDSFPRLRIVGRFSGGYTPAQEEQILLAIQKAQPTLLLVGSGVPRRELWLLSNKKRLRAGLALWVGDCFEVFAGKKRNAPSRGRALLHLTLGSVVRPWRLLRIASLAYFLALVAVHRLRHF